MASPSKQEVNGNLRFGRSRIANGKLPKGVDGRSAVARRYRDIKRGLETVFEATTESELALLHQAAVLTVISEQLQAELVRGQPISVRDSHQTCGSTAQDTRRPAHEEQFAWTGAAEHPRAR